MSTELDNCSNSLWLLQQYVSVQCDTTYYDVAANSRMWDSMTQLWKCLSSKWYVWWHSIWSDRQAIGHESFLESLSNQHPPQMQELVWFWSRRASVLWGHGPLQGARRSEVMNPVVKFKKFDKLELHILDFLRYRLHSVHSDTRRE